ncbi:DUF4097 family beta strand repeat-containing protein [Pseudomarimonas salicorniae]|uniref:DUF2807 domain-containing protein n=1 Tax=Pseudomarimonas salicorniae TaxID=2933270 RepID=A0ABT0GLF6_9GAMM|nr:DUF4097 family beta strand repeat-containing protein [Lysobacter sp. CAU 1642]MCK7595373.1 DUF2807 domain-containing protein [Lysobacter sp. CAU 1642]
MKANLTAVALLALAPALALADDCKHSAPRTLDLDLRDVESVRFEVGNGELVVVPAKGAPVVAGQACSSDPDRLDGIVLRQRRVGNELRVEMRTESNFSGIFFGRTYAYLRINAELPADLPVAIELGSGDATLEGIRQVDADVGSGDLAVREADRVRLGVGSGDAELIRIAGEVVVEVGSGDAIIRDAGQLLVTRVGSGDLEAERVRGDVRIERLGSGDIKLDGVAGNVHVEDIGSGDLSVRDLAGDLVVDDIGSGDVDHRNVAGKVTLPDD